MGVRKRVIALSCALLCVVCIAGFFGITMSNRPDRSNTYVVQADGPGKVVYTADDSGVVKLLNTQDAQWQLDTAKAVADYELAMSANEQRRAELEAEKRAKQQEFLDAQRAILEEQQKLLAELQQKAQEEILAQGGTDITNTGHLDITGQMGRPSQTVNQPQPPIVTENPNLSTGTEGTEGYYGQFTVELVCTCETCFDPVEWDQFYPGQSCLLVDGQYIPSGVTVALTDPEGLKLSTTQSSAVSGRSCIALVGNHSIAGGGGLVYPKITKAD